MANNPHPWRVGCWLTLACLVGAGAAIWFFWIEPTLARHRWILRVEANIRSLASKRPPNVTQVYWGCLVVGTVNLSTNCPYPLTTVRRSELDIFADEFERRLEGAPELEIIDWIWDEFIRLTKYAAEYDRFRPTRPENDCEKWK